MTPRIQKRTTLVVPCYNEALRLQAGPFRDAVAANENLEIVFVNDGSDDGTQQVLEQLCAANSARLVPLALARNSGKAEAVRAGVNHAFERGAELIGYWDADLATPLDYVAEFAEVLKDPQVMMVLGSRTRLLGHRVTRDPVRHYLGRGFATVASLVLGLPVYDTQCGAKLFRAAPALKSVFSRPFEQNWTFDVELLQRLLEEERLHGTISVLDQCREYPLRDWHDAPGSKLSVRHAPRVAYEMALLCARSFRARRRG